MSVWSRIASVFKDERSLTVSPPQYGIHRLPVYEAGTTLTVDEALYVSTVWACMDVLVRSLAPRPWNIYEFSGEQRSLRKDDSISWMLNTQPNPEMTAISAREAILYSAIGWGNGYAEIVRDGANRPRELWPLEPDRVQPWRDEATGAFGYKVIQYQGGTVWVPPSRIYHLRGPATYTGLSGDSLLFRASRAIAIASGAQQFSANFLRNGSILSGVLETDKKVGKPSIDSMRAQWREGFTGFYNAGQLLVLPEGFKWKEMAFDANRAQLLDTRKFQIAEVARFFGVPLHKIGVAESAQGYGTNIEQLGIEFVRDTVRPWAERCEQEADIKLLGGRGPVRESRIDLSELTQGDLKSQMEAAKIGVESGILTLNEARERFNYNHIGSDGDEHFVSSSVKPLEQALEPPAPQAAAAAPKPAPAEEGDDMEPGEMESGDMANLAREAAVAMYAGALDRYAKRLAKRREAMQRQAPDKLEENLAAERERGIATVRGEVTDADALLKRAGLSAPNGELVTFLSAVEQGEPPKLAAWRLLGAESKS